MTRYFQGQSVTGPVRASPARTFREVVDALRICPTLGISHGDFLALSEKDRNTAKQVPFFVAAVFKESPCKRVYEQALHCNLIFLDIDPEKEQRNGKWVETGRYPAAPFVNDPDSLYTALAGYNFAAHLTASSTPEKPRMRIIVDADKIPLSAYPRAAMSVGSLLGLPAITKESKVSVQPMFLPVLFSDSTEEEHPLLAYSLEGQPFTVRDISEGLFPEYDATKTPSVDTTLDGGIDALEFLRAPVPEISLAVAKEALAHIDADISRADWLSCAAALKHQFSPHKADEAFTIFDEWSAQGSKYNGEKETEAIWNSLRPTPIGRVPVTIRSLLRSAVAAGWDDKKVKENCFNTVITWLDECPSVTELMEKGARKILGTPLLSAVQEDVLIHRLCASAKKRFAQPLSASAIRKDITRMKAEIRAQEKPAEKTREPLWARGVCYISSAQEFYRHRTGEKYRPEAFNSMYARHLLPSEDSLKEAGIPVTPATLSRPIVAPSDYALNHLKLVTGYDYAYDPGQPTELFFVNRGKRYINVYSPTYPELDTKRASMAGEVLHQHLGKLVAETEYRRTLLDFMAYMVQFPGRKIRWAVLIQSAEGAGKTFFAKVMQAVLGFEHVKILGDGAIKKGYNEWAFGHQLIAVEEIYVSGSNRLAVMNAIKPLITNDDISVDEKFRNNRQVVNISNYMLFSNHHDALALTPNDRRYFVVKSPLQHKEQVKALGEDYFAPIYEAVKGHPGAFRSFLLDWPISPDFRPDGHAPRTSYVAEMISDSAGDTVAAIRRMLLEGDYPLLQYDIVSAKTILDALKMEDGIYRATPQSVSSVLREEGFHQIGRHLIGDDRHYLWTRQGVCQETAPDVARKRVKNNLHRLCMELLF